MTIPSLATLDVRDILKSGGEPFAEIMQAIASLSPGQGLRLLATFKPVPLFGIMAQRGFGHTEREIGGGDWEVIFTPSNTLAAPVGAGAPAVSGRAEAPPTGSLDLRGLDPPEPMRRALEAIEALRPGDSLVVVTDREPLLLHRELDRRKHAFVSEIRSDGCRTTIRRGDGQGDAP